MSSRFERLKIEILERSEEKRVFEKAVLEWKYIRIVKPSHAQFCLCSQKIEKDFVIKNVLNGTEAVVGSVCVNRFMYHNVQLVKDVVRAEYEHVCRPCNRCKEWTKHPDICKKCEKYEKELDKDAEAYAARELLLEQERIQQIEMKRQLILRTEKWEKLKSMIPDKLNSVEWEFVYESVHGCIMRNKKLSDKQRAWLRRIVMSRR